MSLLTDAYQRRDRVGLVVFQKDRASLVLPPTNSVLLAKQAMSDIPVGGKTPLSAGLLMTLESVMREKNLNPDVMPMMILLTDGAGNVSISDSISPQDEAHSIARRIHEADIRTVPSTWNTSPSIKVWRSVSPISWADPVIRWRRFAPITC